MCVVCISYCFDRNQSSPGITRDQTLKTTLTQMLDIFHNYSIVWLCYDEKIYSIPSFLVEAEVEGHRRASWFQMQCWN